MTITRSTTEHFAALRTARVLAAGSAAWATIHQAIRAKLVKANLGLVRHCMVALRVRGDDFESEGMYKLLLAIDRFNPDKGFQFSTYAMLAVLRGLSRVKYVEHRRREHTQDLHGLTLDAFTAPPATGPDPEDLAAANRLMTATLTARERIVFLGRVDGRTLDAIGQGLGICKERVRQIEERATAKLAAAVKEANHGQN